MSALENQYSLAGMNRLHAAVGEAEEIITSTPGMSDQDAAEGYLYLMGLWKWAVDRVFTGFDVFRPRFTRYLDSFARRAHENPDNRYLSAQIDGLGVYRITGNRGAHADLVFEVVAGVPGDNRTSGETIDLIDAASLHIDPDGHYEIIVGPTPGARNHLRSRPDATAIFVRQSVNDWLTETLGTPTIERIDLVDHEPAYARPDGAHVDRLFSETAKLIVDHAHFLREAGDHCRQTHPLNGLTQPSTKVGGGRLAGQYSAVGRFRLDPGQALLMTLTAATAGYQGVTLCHDLWFASLDYRNVQCSLSSAQSHLSSDGLYRYVISGTDPGVPNWLDPAGRERGFVMFRWQNVTGLAPRVLDASVVPTASLRGRFPADEPDVDPATRLRILRSRRLAIDQRFI